MHREKIYMDMLFLFCILCLRMASYLMLFILF